MYGIGQYTDLFTSSLENDGFQLREAVTIFADIPFFTLMPAGPGTAWFLNPEERTMAAARLASKHDGGDKTTISRKQFIEACLKQKAWLTFLFGALVTMPSPVLIFASRVIKSLGYTSAQTLLYGVPSGAVQIFFIWVGMFGCCFFPNQRCLVVLLLTLVRLTGCILLAVLGESAGWGVIVASWLACVISTQSGILMSLSASNVRGNIEKAVVNALLFMGYSTGVVSAPQLSTKPPRYRAGVICALVDWGLVYIFIPYY